MCLDYDAYVCVYIYIYIYIYTHTYTIYIYIHKISRRTPRPISAPGASVCFGPAPGQVLDDNEI